MKTLRITLSKIHRKRLKFITNNNTFIKQTIRILTLHHFLVWKTTFTSYTFLDFIFFGIRLFFSCGKNKESDLRSRTRQCDSDYTAIFFCATKREGGSQVVAFMLSCLTLLLISLLEAGWRKWWRYILKSCYNFLIKQFTTIFQYIFLRSKPNNFHIRNYFEYNLRFNILNVFQTE